MQADRFLDIPPARLDDNVYRIFSVDRLFELFSRKQNALVKPLKWEDPFENFILRSRIQLATGELGAIEGRDSFYGQCWTLQKASDAMWRIYSPNGDAVRIRSTARKLVQGLVGSVRGEAFVGKVRYLRNDKLISFAKNSLRHANRSSAAAFARTLLVKRPAFAHEKEVRLLFMNHDVSKATGDVFFYDIDPHAMIDQIMIDPRLSVVKAKALRNQINHETGFHLRRIKRSLLYAPPPNLIL
jgi:hypothetical protein